MRAHKPPGDDCHVSNIALHRWLLAFGGIGVFGSVVEYCLGRRFGVLEIPPKGHRGVASKPIVFVATGEALVIEWRKIQIQIGLRLRLRLSLFHRKFDVKVWFG